MQLPKEAVISCSSGPETWRVIERLLADGYTYSWHEQRMEALRYRLLHIKAPRGVRVYSGKFSTARLYFYRAHYERLPWFRASDILEDSVTVASSATAENELLLLI